jgi:hypothetical protein
MAFPRRIEELARSLERLSNPTTEADIQKAIDDVAADEAGGSIRKDDIHVRNFEETWTDCCARRASRAPLTRRCDGAIG